MAIQMITIIVIINNTGWSCGLSRPNRLGTSTNVVCTCTCMYIYIYIYVIHMCIYIYIDIMKYTDNNNQMNYDDNSKYDNNIAA